MRARGQLAFCDSPAARGPSVPLVRLCPGRVGAACAHEGSSWAAQGAQYSLAPSNTGRLSVLPAAAPCHA